MIVKMTTGPILFFVPFTYRGNFFPARMRVWGVVFGTRNISQGLPFSAYSLPPSFFTLFNCRCGNLFVQELSLLIQRPPHLKTWSLVCHPRRLFWKFASLKPSSNFSVSLLFSGRSSRFTGNHVVRFDLLVSYDLPFPSWIPHARSFWHFPIAVRELGRAFNQTAWRKFLSCWFPRFSMGSHVFGFGRSV